MVARHLAGREFEGLLQPGSQRGQVDAAGLGHDGVISSTVDSPRDFAANSSRQGTTERIAAWNDYTRLASGALPVKEVSCRDLSMFSHRVSLPPGLESGGEPTP